ncbi:zinc transporter ZIP4-like [Lethenteron reissneri]|uniref:zinc transporter ZIP4-like n=1 Tax=Lethenteron reissneri TaxID=7753 RepID=UPI002AB77E79|nr:zinc transporter ZIP4-like [Lethenteron reissneri]
MKPGRCEATRFAMLLLLLPISLWAQRALAAPHGRVPYTTTSTQVALTADYFLDYILKSYGNGSVLTTHGLEKIMQDLGIGEEHHEHTRQRQLNANEIQACISSHDLTEIFGVSGEVWSRSELMSASPALLQQLLSHACRAPNDTHTGEANTRPSKAHKYGYGTLASLLVSALSLIGVVTVTCSSCTHVYVYSQQALFGLAVGSMTGDAILHLLPKLLGLHVHSAEDDLHANDNLYIWKLLTVIGGLYVFLMLEQLFTILTRDDAKVNDECDLHGCKMETCTDVGKTVLSDKEKQDISYEKDTQQTGKINLSTIDLIAEHEASHLPISIRKKGLNAIVLMVLIGDGLHNFADGLALGAAFSLSLGDGLATMLAVALHELPHEIGDFAILLNTGLSVRAALGLNLLSALTALVGFYIGASVSENEMAMQWIIAFATGMFLYLSINNMIFEMKRSHVDRPWLLLLLQNLGLFLGWACMLLLALYEDKLHF